MTCVIDDRTMEKIVRYVGEAYDVEEVFKDETLVDWAVQEGMVYPDVEKEMIDRLPEILSDFLQGFFSDNSPSYSYWNHRFAKRYCDRLVKSMLEDFGKYMNSWLLTNQNKGVSNG